MTLEEILEKLHSPTEHAITLENGELTALLEELKDLREENKVLISECDRLIKEKGELLNKVSGGDVLRICQLEEQIEKAKRLLKAAVEDFDTMHNHIWDCTDCKSCPLNRGGLGICGQMWRYADEALKLIGGN